MTDFEVGVSLISPALFNGTSGLVANGPVAFIALSESSSSGVGTVATSINSGTVFSFGNNSLFAYNSLGPLTKDGLQ